MEGAALVVQLNMTAGGWEETGTGSQQHACCRIWRRKTREMRSGD